MMDNFDLHSYLRNNPLLKESVEKEEKKKLTKEEFKAMVKEMVLAETGVDEYLGGTMGVSKNYGMDDDSQTEGDFFTISLPNGFPVQYAGSYEEAKAWVEKNDPEGMKDYQIDQVDESLNEMARIATFYVLTDDFEEAIAGMPENKQKSSRYQRVINYLKDNGQGTLKDIADEEFRTSETAAVSPIMADLVSYGVAKKGDLVAPKKEKSVGDGTRGRKMSDVGRVKSAMEKFKAGSSDYTDEERVALKAFIDSIAATLEEGKVNEEEDYVNEEDSMGKIGSSYSSPNKKKPISKIDVYAEDIAKTYFQGETVKDIQTVIKKEGLKGLALVDWIVEDMEIVEQEFGEGAILSWMNHKGWISSPDKIKSSAMKKAAKMIVAKL